MNRGTFVGILLGVAILAPSLAQSQISRGAGVKENRSFVYHGKVVRPDGSTPNGSMSITLKILSPDPGLCVLWTETQTINMQEGQFTAELGHTVHRLPGAAGGAAANFKQAFVNNPSLTITGAQCASGNSYTPTASDDRLLTAQFNDSGSVIEIAGLPIKSVPFALQAEEIAGFGIANIAKISGVGSSVTYSPSEIATMKDMLGGDVFFDMKSRAVKNVAAPVDPNDAANKSWVLSQISSSGGGTVSSVGFTAPSIFGVSGSPVTSSGSIGLTLANQAANSVFAGPASGGAAAPTFRALDANDIPALDAAKITSGTFTATQIPSLDATKIGSGTLAAGRIPSLDASKITTGTLAADRGGTGLVPAVADGNKVYALNAAGTATEFKSITNGSGVSISHSAGTIQISATGSGGTVTSVGVGGLPLSISNPTTTPSISIAQANTTTAGYLSAADWNTFNNKQPAGAYLTSITGGNVTTALGFTPVSNALATGQVLLGVGGVATASNFGIGQMRNNVGTLQMPTSCTASQTLTWSAVTDVLVCSNIDGLNADKITAGTLAAARLGSGTADSTKYLRGDGTWQTLPSGADHLGNHTATQNLNLANFKLVGNGGSEGISVTSGGNVGVGNVTATSALSVRAAGTAITDFIGANGVQGATLTSSTNNYTNFKVFDGGGRSITVTSQPNDLATTDAYLSAIASGIGAGVSLSSAVNADNNHLTLRARGAIALYTNSGSTALNERLRVTPAGDVGIGTSSPTAKLDVNGTINATNMTINGVPVGTGAGTVTSVGVSGLPLGVTNASSTPTISIAQANTTTAGYLSAADWNTFNNKQPAGAYLTSVSSGNVTTALGYTPLSQTLTANQVFVGNGSNVATASYFGIEQMRNASGVAQFPSACTDSQTLTWSAITDTLSCTNINNLNADKITAGTIASARLGSGTADSTTFLRGDGTWAVPAGGGGGGAIPSFRATRTSNQTVTNNTTTKLDYNNEVFDSNNNFDPATDRFTPTVAGKYLVVNAVYCNDAGAFVSAVISKNGTQVAADRRNGGTYLGTSTVTTIVDMNGTTDYLEASVYLYGGTSISSAADHTYFTASLLGGGGGSGTPGGSTTQMQFNDAGSFAGASGFVWDKTNSRVGVGTTTPQAKLEVNGGVKIGDDSTCNAAKVGTVRYNSSSLQVCDGTNFTNVGANGGTSSTGVIAPTNLPDIILCGTGSYTYTYIKDYYEPAGSGSNKVRFMNPYNDGYVYYSHVDGTKGSTYGTATNCPANISSVTQKYALGGGTPTATLGYGTPATTTASTTSTSGVQVPEFSASVAVSAGDKVMATLACNLRASTSTVYMKMYASSSPGGSWLQDPNYITVSSSTWSGGSSIGIYQATSAGTLVIHPIWHVGAGTGYWVYCNINAFVVGK